MTMCLPCRRMRKPAFSKARTAWRWGTPASFPTFLTDCHFHFAYVPAACQFLDRIQVFTNCDADIVQRFLLRCSLGPTTGKTGTRNGEAFALGRNQHHLISHIAMLLPGNHRAMLVKYLLLSHFLSLTVKVFKCRSSDSGASTSSSTYPSRYSRPSTTALASIAASAFPSDCGTRKRARLTGSCSII